MKNLFDYATKELSQDAFLRWLFENGFDENCQNEKLKKAARNLFNEFTNNEFKDKEVKELITVAQWKKIDISVWFKVDGMKHLIVIEDKTDSKEHNQLTKYDSEIEKHNKNCKRKKSNLRYIENGKIFKVFYKTYTISEEEKQRVENSDWKIFGIDEISKVFSQCENSNIQLLDDYIEHIEKIKKAIKNKEKPTEHGTTIDCVKWEAYFNNTVVPKLKEELEKENIFDLKFSVFKTMYSYICLCIEKYEKAPYLEIRSRDCLNDELCARILCYGIYDDNKETKIKNVNSLFEEIKKQKFFSQKNCKKNVQEKKQIGFKSYTEIPNDPTFLASIVESIHQYLNVMKTWSN